MKKRLRIALPLLVIIAGALIWHFRFREQGPAGQILVSGNIEVTQVDVSFKIPGRLVQRLVDEGDQVTARQLVARLDPKDQRLNENRAAAELAYSQAVLAELTAGSRPEELRRAKAGVARARFALEELETGSRNQEVADARAARQRARAAQKTAASNLALAQDDHDRYRQLLTDKVVSRREYDEVRTRFEAAQNALAEAKAHLRSADQRLSLIEEGPRKEQIRRAQAALEQAEAEYALVKAGPRKEAIAQAQARVTAAEEALAQARQQLADTEVRAPFDGVVLSKSAEPGAYLNPGTPVVTLAQLDRVWLRAFISGNDLGRIQRDQEVTVTTDAFPDRRFTGRISFISSQAEFTPKSVQTFEERVSLMYRIKIDLENPEGILKPGMPADANIVTGQTEG